MRSKDVWGTKCPVHVPGRIIFDVTTVDGRAAPACRIRKQVGTIARPRIYFQWGVYHCISQDQYDGY